jgi:hypothetical protein
VTIRTITTYTKKGRPFIMRYCFDQTSGSCPIRACRNSSKQVPVMDKESGARLSLIKGLSPRLILRSGRFRRWCKFLFLNLVDEMGFEPTTSSLRTRENLS